MNNKIPEMAKFSQLEYKRPDIPALKKALQNQQKDFKNAKTYEEARKIHLDMEKLTIDIATMYSIASIRNTADKSDSYYEQEVEYLEKSISGLMMLQKKSKELMLKTPFRADFEKEFGKMITMGLEDEIKHTTIRNLPLKIKEMKLCQAYSKEAALCKTNFRGEECNFYGLLKHMQSTDREERKEAFKAFSKLYESISPRLDDCYNKLAKIRIKMAKRAKHKDYIEMAYLDRHRFDYKREDVEVFRNQVVKYIVPACQKLFDEQAKRLGIDKLRFYDEALVYPEGNAVPQGTMSEMLQAAEKMYHELSPETGEFFSFMVEHDLFDLETRPNKHLGGYCTSLELYRAPFIFSNFNGTSADVDVLTHEAGHAFEYYLASRTQPLVDYFGSTSEINEIHSMTMEHFTYPWMELFFGENANKYRYAHLASALTTIPYLVAVDEFQHRMYDRSDMTAMERRAIWHEIERKYMPWRDYDGDKFMEEGGYWMQKQHIFLYPFYYIDYALAQLGAFELYNRSKNNKTEAWNDYITLCRAGGSRSYLELLKLAKLRSPFKEGSVTAILEPILKELNI